MKAAAWAAADTTRYFIKPEILQGYEVNDKDVNHGKNGSLTG